MTIALTLYKYFKKIICKNQGILKLYFICILIINIYF